MIGFALYDGNIEECRQLKLSIRDSMAFLSDEMLRLEAYESTEGYLKLISGGSIYDLACLDITETNGIEMAEQFRENHGNSMIMLIASSEMSPLEYIRPSIMAAGLALRPYDRESIHKAVHDFLKSYIECYRKQPDSGLVIETRDDMVRLPYDSIYYIEAREKKVFIRTRHEEYGYYNTLDSMVNELPDSFVRCHRGYIVNTGRIKRLLKAENLIELDDGLIIPVSRSMKNEIKGLVR